MATLKQIQANRLNAKKSTGPRSVEGKAKSRFNALKSGIDAQSAVIPDEDPVKFQELADEYYTRFQPQSPEERDLLDTLITAVWQLRRLRRVETQIWTTRMNETRMSKPVKWTLSETYGINDRLFQRLQSRLNAAERTFRRCLQDLKKLQVEREAPPPPQLALDPSRDRQGAAPSSPQSQEPKRDKHKLASFHKPISQASEGLSPAPKSPPTSPNQPDSPPSKPLNTDPG